MKIADALAMHPSELWSDVQREAALESNTRELIMSEREVSGYLAEVNPEEQAMIAERGENLYHLLTTLTPREKEVLERRNGMSGREPQTLRDIARDLNVSQERVRQIESKALRKMRHPSRSRYILPPGDDNI